MKAIEFEVTLENFQNDIRQLYTLLRPGVMVDEISEFVEIEVGVVNTIVKIDDPKSNEPVVIRVYAMRLLQSMSEEQRKTAKPLRIDRALELEAIRKASELGIGPKLYATFSNGFICKYIDGPMGSFELYDLPVAQKTAVKMAKLHRMRLDDKLVRPKPSVYWLVGKEGDKEFLLKEREAFDKKLEESGIEQLRSLPSYSALSEEYERMHELVFERDAYGPVCFCHNDLNLSNLLIDRKTKEPIFIDFEWVSSTR